MSKKPTPHEPWYVLEDGTRADPTDVEPDDSGVLRHNKSGKAVAMRSPGVPMTSGADAKKAMKPETESSKSAYKTRESKSE